MLKRLKAKAGGGATESAAADPSALTHGGAAGADEDGLDEKAGGTESAADGAGPQTLADFLVVAKLDDGSLAEPHGYLALLVAGGLEQLDDAGDIDEARLEQLGMAKIMHRKRFLRHMAKAKRVDAAATGVSHGGASP